MDMGHQRALATSLSRRKCNQGAFWASHLELLYPVMHVGVENLRPTYTDPVDRILGPVREGE